MTKKETKALIEELVAQYEELTSRSSKLENKINLATHRIMVDTAITNVFKDALAEHKIEMQETDVKIENVKDQLTILGYNF